LSEVKKQELICDASIERTVPCLADPNKIRFTARFDEDISSVFPYLNAILNAAIYNHSAKTLTLRKMGRLITLHARSIAASKIDNLQDAQDTIVWLVSLINECHQKRSTITPCFDRRDRLNVIDVVRLLPGTHCKKCGEQTCLSFAALLTAEKASIAACRDLFLAEYWENRAELFSLLRAGGYAVPDAFG
jgi:ArsR family metal-binding transcriptional regulator